MIIGDQGMIKKCRNKHIYKWLKKYVPYGIDDQPKSVINVKNIHCVQVKYHLTSEFVQTECICSQLFFFYVSVKQWAGKEL